MHFIYVQHNQRYFFFCSMLSFSMVPITTKNKWRKYCRMENESRAHNKIKRNVCWVFHDVVVVMLFIYSFVHAMPFHNPIIRWMKICSISFRCENIWKYIWQTNLCTEADRNNVIKVREKYWTIKLWKTHTSRSNGGIVDSSFVPNFSRNQKCISFLRKRIKKKICFFFITPTVDLNT